ncbi:hypothetical protein KAF25_002485 [Fusarium avenaceum]|uniref:NADP-dependent oxidoreductase domain-containing protein n=1 Tax=Fusarium avenaceum TaxID=40199 RepID=A0A9P7H154_9HYPO|nr:hypothetical protein KAF25_002485 [Fusarium avenaceum]
MTVTNNILITGGAGFLGPMLAAKLSQDPSNRIFLTDLHEPPTPKNVADIARCTCIAADMTKSSHIDRLLASAPEWRAIFIFHGIMSVGCEENPALSQLVNINATQSLLTAVSELNNGPRKPRVVYASTQAVYGPPYTTSGTITDDTPATPIGVYGTHKLITECTVNDMNRRGLIDAFSVRLPTVTVRPGAPSRSAAAFLSGLIREPMAGLECIIPLSDRDARQIICSPRIMIDNLITLISVPSDSMPSHIRAIYMPGISVTLGEMYDAFEAVCGANKLKLLREEKDIEAESATALHNTTHTCTMNALRNQVNLSATLNSRGISAGAVRTRKTFQTRCVATALTRFKLNTGASIPAIGFGTFQDPAAQEDAVSRALKAGLRLIDTARVYNVEKEVGRGIKRSGIPREDIFLGTKLWCNNFHPDDVERALDESLTDLDTPYVDLLMMHYPCTFQRGEDRFPRDKNGKMIHGETNYVDTWKAMEKLVKTGKVKALGVSNFSKRELEELINDAQVPAVHQMEVHPYLQQKGFNEWLRSQGIHVVQFSPLGNMNDFYRATGWSKEVAHMMRVIDQPLLKQLGEKYGKSAVQIVLSWGINSGRSVIPKSTIDWQIKENAEASFKMEPEDVKAIEALDIKARFNDPSFDYRWRLYSDLEGIEGTKDGRTH